MQHFEDRIVLGHGSGGALSHRLIEDHMLPAWENPLLAELGDAAVCSIDGRRIAFTTDSYVVTPLFFPGGSIGRLAVCGTVNDLAVTGARPQFLSCAFILEEGLPLETLDRVIAEMRLAAEEAGVQIITGDTKVVPGGSADKMFINTAGIGFVDDSIILGAAKVQPGDAVLVSGTLGDHGIAVMLEREGMKFDARIQSDAAPLGHMLGQLLDARLRLRFMRDPTRGGLAATLNEIAGNAECGIHLNESDVPVRPPVASACEILGLDPLYVANEGKCVVIIHPNDAEQAISIMHANQYGKEAAQIGIVTEAPPGKVIVRTAIGGERIVDMPAGELLPRIC